jgi:uncharacterized protein (DUF1330 family)
MAQWVLNRYADLRNNIGVQSVGQARAVRGESNAHTWRVTVLDGMAAANLDGYSAQCSYIRPDGGTVYIDGSISGNVAEIVFPAACYAYAGTGSAILRLINNAAGVNVVIDGLMFTISESETDVAIDPGNVVPSLSELLAQMDAMVSAENARVEAENARVAAEEIRAAFYDGFSSQLADNANYTSILNNATLVELTLGAYIVTTAPITLTPVSNAAWAYAIVSCSPGDVFSVIGAYGISSARAWTFINDSNAIITQGASTLESVTERIVCPPTATKLIFNRKNAGILIAGEITASVLNTFKSDSQKLIGLTEIDFTYGQYFETSATLSDAIINKQYKSAILDCVPRDKFTIDGIGGGSLIGTYAFYNSNDELIFSEANELNNEIIVAPPDAAKIVINIRVTVKDATCYSGAAYTDGSDEKTHVPYYYRQHIDAKIAEINALDDDSAFNGDSFIFITDYHVQANSRNSSALIKRIMEETGTRFIVNGGDVQDYEETFAAAMSCNVDFKTDFKHLWRDMYNIVGNHEFNAHYETAEDTSMLLSYGQIYNFFLKQRENQYGGFNRYGDYYVDNVPQKIRYFFIGCTAGVAITSEQRAWLFKEMENIPDDYTFFVFSHLTFKYVTADETKIFVASNTAKIAEGMTKFNNRTTFTTDGVTYDYTAKDAIAAAIIGGHTHYDASTEYENLSDIDGNLVEWNYVPIIATTTDALLKQQTNTGELERVACTVSEQAFDVVRIDKTNRTIHMIRIGAGSDRTFTY